MRIYAMLKVWNDVKQLFYILFFVKNVCLSSEVLVTANMLKSEEDRGEKSFVSWTC